MPLTTLSLSGPITEPAEKLTSLLLLWVRNYSIAAKKVNSPSKPSTVLFSISNLASIEREEFISRSSPSSRDSGSRKSVALPYEMRGDAEEKKEKERIETKEE